MRRVPSLIFVVLVSVPRVAWTQGNPLGPEFRVNTNTAGPQTDPDVARDAAGNFVVVWGQGGLVDDVFGQRYDSSGAPQGPEFRVNTYLTNIQGLPAVSVHSPTGNFVVVWQSSYPANPNFDNIFGQRYSSSGAPLGPEFRVNTFTTSSQSVPSIATDSTGNFVVVWTSEAQDGSDRGVFGQRYNSVGTPQGPEFRINTFTLDNQEAASVAADSAGRFVVAWTSFGQDEYRWGVFAQRFDSSGAPLGPEFRVNAFTGSDETAPAAATDAAGNFVIAWSTGGYYSLVSGVFGQRYASSGSPQGPEFRINSFSGGPIDPHVASDAAGNFAVVWTSFDQDGSFAGIFGQRHDSAGVAQGPEFRVNTYVTYNQMSPSVAADSTLGNFVVVWRSDNQDGSGAGIYGQRFGQIVPVELMRFGVE